MKTVGLCRPSIINRMVMKKTVMVEGMKCEHCAAKLESMLNTVEGLTAKVDLASKTALLESEHEISDDDIRGMIDFAGFKAADIH